MILVDTTVWVDLFGERDTKGTRSLVAAIEEEEDLATCGLVMTEVLQGVRHERMFSRIESILQDLIYLPMSQATFIAAARMYRECRKKGVTIRKPVDCMIAATCIEHAAFILHNDRDFDHIARHFPLQSC